MKVPQLVITLACLLGNMVLSQVAWGQLPPRLAKFSREAVGYARCADGAAVQKISAGCASGHVCGGNCCQQTCLAWPDFKQIGSRLFKAGMPCNSTNRCAARGGGKGTGSVQGKGIVKSGAMPGCKCSGSSKAQGPPRGLSLPLSRDCIVLRLGRKLSQLRLGCARCSKSKQLANCCHTHGPQHPQLLPSQPSPAEPPSPQPLPGRTTPRDPVPSNPFLDDPPVQTRMRLSDSAHRVVRAKPLARQSIVLRIDDQ